ncbi:MAG TPA: glycosyltransferase family 39 protein [Rhodanobacteraceae bacterium]|nr:glycosyltransferase family 39 protein [Rhodanobacteraceae bacterium]
MSGRHLSRFDQHAAAGGALALWCALLLPLAVLFPPIPIDETRYLTAAWEMFNATQWLVPTVDGAWYSDKSPLLFWLIAGGWKLLGVHTWVARVEALAIALGMLLTLRRLALRLGLERVGAERAMWLLAGSLGLVVFSTAIMFDLLLTLTVLGAVHALLDLDAGKWARGTLALGISLGLGFLAKGPVVLLHVLPLALLAPAWSLTARRQVWRWYGLVLAGCVIGIAILACWLLPAAWYAGPAYWHPLIDKVAGRIDHSFAHRRPIWWYLPLLPVLALPWLLALRAPRAAWMQVWRGRFGRFFACWWVVPFVAFCLISGKQVHYLLPLLPAWALGGAWLLQQAGSRLRPRLFGVLAVLIGVVLLALPWLAARRYGLALHPALAALALVAWGVAVGVWRCWGHDARALALSATALVAVAMLAGALAWLPALDVQPEARFIDAAMARGTPIVTVDSPDGLFGYEGRLRQPLHWVTPAALAAWCRAHPEGIVMTMSRHGEPATGTPFKTWPYLLSGSRRIAAWHAADLIAPADRAALVR